MYLCGHQRCEACGYTNFYAWRLDAAHDGMPCFACGEFANVLVGPQYSLRMVPDEFARVTLDEAITRLVHRRTRH